MTNRRQKIEELMESFQSLRRSMAFSSMGSAGMPRITPSQWGVLMLIGQREGSTVKDIAESLRISSSAATQLIDGLVESGYVTRQESAEDRRSVTLTLSKKSKTQVDRMKSYALKKFLTMFKALSDVEFEQYVKLSKKLVRHSLPKKEL